MHDISALTHMTEGTDAYWLVDYTRHHQILLQQESKASVRGRKAMQRARFATLAHCSALRLTPELASRNIYLDGRLRTRHLLLRNIRSHKEWRPLPRFHVRVHVR